MSKSNCEPALLSSLETLQHNLQDAGMLRMKASLYSEAAVREALGDSEYRRISEKLDRRALLAQLDAVSLFLLQVLGLVSVGEGDGDLLSAEQVSVQDVRYGEAITKKYTEAQAAEIDKQKALNEQQVAKTEAETKKIKAQGEADANAVLNESLTDNVLKQHYIDALSNADQLVVVPDGADTLVQTK